VTRTSVRFAAAAAGPRPVLGPGDEAGAHRVLEHVLDRGGEVLLALDHPRREAFAEEMAPAFAPPIERLGVDPVEPPHPLGEAPELGLEDEVVVVRHQAEGVHAPVVALHLLREEAEEQAEVVNHPERHRARHASGRDVVDPARRELVSRSPHTRRR
jgi:hypothetical protein